MDRAEAESPPVGLFGVACERNVEFGYDLEVVAIAARGSGGLLERLFFAGVAAHAPAAWSAAKHVTVLEQAIEHGGDRRRIAEELAPVLHRAIRSHQRACPFVPPHDDLEEVLGGGGGELAHAEIVHEE